MNSSDQQQFQQNMQMGSGLTRYHSAPSSYFATLLTTTCTSSDAGFGEAEFEHFFNPQDSTPETHKIFSGFIDNSNTIQENCSSKTSSSQPQLNTHLLPPRTSEPHQSNDYSSVPHLIYQSHISDAANSDFQDSRLIGQPGSSSSLVRHSSSPAGLFANINVKNEFGAPVGVENTSQTDYTKRDQDKDYIPGLPSNSWDDSVILSDDFLKGLADNDQRNESGNRSRALLSHHLSLPKSSTELSATEKLMQDSVPCKIRAKRGFATHPRSISERVRRTKISERIRKLQELVPNMEKQTNTADMLDLAVDYIKDLQRQVKTLVDNGAKCSCNQTAVIDQRPLQS